MKLKYLKHSFCFVYSFNYSITVQNLNGSRLVPAVDKHVSLKFVARFEVSALSIDAEYWYGIGYHSIDTIAMLNPSQHTHTVELQRLPSRLILQGQIIYFHYVALIKFTVLKVYYLSS